MVTNWRLAKLRSHRKGPRRSLRPQLAAWMASDRRHKIVPLPVLFRAVSKTKILHISLSMEAEMNGKLFHKVAENSGNRAARKAAGENRRNGTH